MIFLGIIDAQTPFFVFFFPSLFLARFSAELGNFTVGTELQFDFFLLDIFIFVIIFSFIAIKVKTKSFAFKSHFLEIRKEKEIKPQLSDLGQGPIPLAENWNFETEKNWDKWSKEGWVILHVFVPPADNWHFLAFLGRKSWTYLWTQQQTERYISLPVKVIFGL